MSQKLDFQTVPHPRGARETEAPLGIQYTKKKDLIQQIFRILRNFFSIEFLSFDDKFNVQPRPSEVSECQLPTSSSKGQEIL